METPTLNKHITVKSNIKLNAISHKDIINLCVSIFYDKAMWDVLVVDAIIPFVNHNKEFSFFFYLSEHRGGHVRLVFIVKEYEALDIAKTIDTFFNHFLTVTPSNLVEKKEDFFQFFMNFKNNTIHYGLFEYETDSWQNFHIGLTDLLFFVFNEYKNEFHLSINEIMFQILTIFFNALKISDCQILKIFRDFAKSENEFNQYDLKLPQEVADLHEEYFLENKDILFTYLKEYRNANPNIYEVEWEKKWHNLVYSFFHETFDLENNEIEIIEALNKIIIGFNVKDRASLYYLFINGIEKYNI